MVLLWWVGIVVSLYGIIHVLLLVKERLRILTLLHALPGPPSKIFLKHLVYLQTGRASVFKTLRYWGKTYGPVYNISATSLFPSANISGSEEFEKIASTTKHIEKSSIYKLFDRWLGQGLLTSTGSLWHTRRKILTPAFHFSILQNFVSIFNSETKKLVNDLQKETDKPWINILPHISLFTLYSITETSMGSTLNISTSADKSYIKAILELGGLLAERLLRPWGYNKLYDYISPDGIKERKITNDIHDFTQKIITERSKQFKKFQVPSENDSYSMRKKLAFLDLLLNGKEDGNIDDQGIKDEVNTFMFEGHDTTSMSICFTLMLLANYRKYQDEIYEEVVTVIGDNEDPDINRLNDLRLMERFIKESLRLYPSVPFISRSLEEDTIVNGYLLPNKAIVNIHIFDIHRNEKDWPEPEKFDPDRFLPENCVNRHPYAYVPFSAGPRNCIGQRFAMLEIKAVLCGILRNFILEPIDTPETIRMVTDLVLRPENNNIKIKISPRHNKI
ncbi:cytochrome P450 4C1-like isoform X2 [Diorhabda carinulata]|uniref:cytochrome P450 4C1-like isoform X2 n=1 Tax=Diorhabda carinulata TaxID=1163345 RepID=UPI0025A20097|nr:cytochrome P450 4C1-like isoform X2 [Diorhabda carinulata]